MGPLWGAAKRDAFAAAELFVLPSLSESFGIAVCEALGAGVPALVTTGTPWEEVETERCGWQVDATVDDISMGLAAAVGQSRAGLAEMGERGKLFVSRRYTWPSVAEQTLRLYRWLCGDGPPPVHPVRAWRPDAPGLIGRCSRLTLCLGLPGSLLFVMRPPAPVTAAGASSPRERPATRPLIA